MAIAKYVGNIPAFHLQHKYASSEELKNKKQIIGLFIIIYLKDRTPCLFSILWIKNLNLLVDITL